MLKMDFKQNLLSLFSLIIVWSLSSSARAALETDPPLTSLQVSGDYVAISAGATFPFVIPTGFNLGVSPGGDSVTTSIAGAVLSFNGNSIASGQIGGAPNSLVFANINGGAAGTTVTFNGVVNSTLASFTSASTMVFNANTSAALHYNGFNGTAILGPGAIFNGAATTNAANTGILTLNGNSHYIGAVGDPTFFINQINLNGNAAITGAIASQNYVVGPNTLTQVGSVTFPAAAQLTTRVLSDSAFGRINAPGSAINFTTGLQVNVLIDNTVILSGVPLQVVTGTSGTFGPSSAPITVTSNNVRFTFIGLNPAGTGNVLLFPSVVPIAPIVPPGFPPGISSVLAAIDATALGATGDLAFVQSLLTALNNLEAIAAAAAQFAPTLNGGNAAMSFEALSQFQNLWASNLIKARSANMCYPDPCASKCNPCSSYDGLSPCDPCRSDCELAWNGEGVWVDGFGYSGKQKTRSLIPGYDAKMYGGMIGIQRPISNEWQLGFGGGYAYTKINGKGIQDNGTKIETPEATVYLGYTCGPWFLDNFITYAWNFYRGFRHIQFPGLDRTAKAKYHGQDYGALVSGGYNYFFPSGLTITPLASVQAMKLRIRGYTEKNAISLDLIQKAQKYEVVQSSLGLMAGYPIQFDCGALYTEIHAKYLYDMVNFRITNSSRFFGGGPVFNTVGVRPARGEVNVGLSSTLFTAGDWALNAAYDLYHRNKFTSQEGTLSVAYKF